MDIIKVEEKDIKTLAALAKDIWFEYWRAIFTLAQIYYLLNKFQSEIALKEQMQKEYYEYYFLEEKSEKIGYFGVVYQDNHLFLAQLYIKSNWRNKGFGKLAFEYIKNLAKEKNFNKIQLAINKHNVRGVLIYEKWGWKLLHPVVTRFSNGFELENFMMEYNL